MTRRQLTFKQYVAPAEGVDPPVNAWWRGLLGRPDDLDAGQLLADSGLAGLPIEQLYCGYLKSAWQGHPRHAFIIASDDLLRPGTRYAVSNEPGPPPR